jgi:hypothetical protein
MKVKVTITLTDDDHTQEGEEMQVEIEETIPGGFQNLDQWEKNVHNIGFRSMRAYKEIFVTHLGNSLSL